MSTINVTTGTAGQGGSTAAELINELRKPMLAVEEFDASTEQYIFEKETLTNAKTIQWNRLERMGVGTTVPQLTEGVAPKPEPVTINSVTATMEEYGRAVWFSSLSVLTARNPLVQEQLRNFGYNIKETRDKLLYAILDAATNTFRVSDRANDNAIEVGDVLSFEEISEVDAVLDGAGAPKKEDGNYALVVHSQQHSSLRTDPNWLAASQMAYADDIRKGMVNMLLGVRVHKTNSNAYAYTASTTGGNSSRIRSAFIAGKGAAKVTDLQAAKLHMQAPGQGNDYTERRYQMAWTMTFKGAIVNQKFLRRMRASSADATAVA